MPDREKVMGTTKKKFKYGCRICSYSELLSPEEVQDMGFRLGTKLRRCTKYENLCKYVAWNCKRVSSRYGN